MTDLTLAYATKTSSTGIPGRAIVSARNHHLVSDDSSDEEFRSGELFLGGIGACAVNMIGRIARTEDIPLAWIEVSADAYRDRDKPQGEISLYDQVNVQFQLWGLSEEQGKYLVDEWKRR